MKRPGNRRAAVELARRQGKDEAAAAVHGAVVAAGVRGAFVRAGAPGRKDDLPGGGVVLVLPPGIASVLRERMEAVEMWMGATQGALDRVRVAAKDLRDFHARERDAVADLHHLLREMMRASNRRGRLR